MQVIFQCRGKGQRKRELTGFDEIIARGKAIGENFIPFSFSDTNFAFALPKLKGMSRYKATRYYADAYEQIAEHADRKEAVNRLMAEVSHAAKINGASEEDIKGWKRAARSQILYSYYTLFFEAYSEKNIKNQNRYATNLKNLGVTRKDLMKSAKAREIDFK